MVAQCPRCLELEDQVARLHALAVSKGLIVDFSEGANPEINVEREFARWRGIFRTASVDVAWRAGWERAWWFARVRLRDWNHRWEAWQRVNERQRAIIGQLLTEISRLTDNGGS